MKLVYFKWLCICQNEAKYSYVALARREWPWSTPNEAGRLEMKRSAFKWFCVLQHEAGHFHLTLSYSA